MKFLCFFHLINLLFIAFCFIRSPEYTGIVCQYMAFNHIIHLQCFNIGIFLKAIQYRLDILSLVDLKHNRINVCHFKTALVQVQKITADIRKSFSMALLFCFFWLYGSIIHNVYWIIFSFVGKSTTEVYYEGNEELIDIIMFQSFDTHLMIKTLVNTICNQIYFSFEKFRWIIATVSKYCHRNWIGEDKFIYS